MEVSDRVYWVRMPLPFSLKWINLWLIDDSDKGWTIVDTGVPTEETKEAWRTIFGSVLGDRPVWRVIVTHMHPDHVGLAGWICRKFPQAELWMTRLEYITCRMLVSDTGREAPEAGVDFYKKAGWTNDQLETYKKRFGGFGKAVSKMPDSYRRIEDGDTLELAGANWTVIIGNGHSPEHACLYSEEKNLLIAGDQILPRISSNVSVFPTEPEANSLQDWISSCEKLKSLIPNDCLVLPAHNEPFIGAQDRLDHLIKGHMIALKRLKQRLGQEPRRVIDVFPAIFGRKIGDDVISMATGEAVAHLNWLIAEGAATKSTDDAGVDWYSVL